jgi:hypothetical protein
LIESWLRDDGTRDDGNDPVPLVFGLPASTAALIVMFLVAIDSLATILWLRSGHGQEINPLMRWVNEEGGDSLFLLVKLALTGLCMLWVTHRASRAYARIAALSAIAIYGPVVGIHIYNGFTHLPG